MDLTKKNIILIVTISSLLATGILGIFIPNIITGNWYSLLTILMFALSLFPPLMCNALDFENNNGLSASLLLMDDDTENDDREKGKSLAWLFMGSFVTIGYSIPFLLWRTKHMPILNMGLTMGGGTVILISIAVFIKYVLIQI